jgi:hypothetical protein
MSWNYCLKSFCIGGGGTMVAAICRCLRGKVRFAIV